MYKVSDNCDQSYQWKRGQGLYGADESREFKE